MCIRDSKQTVRSRQSFFAMASFKTMQDLLFLSHRSNFIHDEEFLALSDLYEWKNLCFPYEDYSPFNLDRWDDRVWVSFRVQISEKRHSHKSRCSWHSRDHTVWTRIYLCRPGGSLHGLKRCSDQLIRSCIWHITPVNHFFTVHKQHLFPLDWCCIAIAVFRIKFISSLYCLPFPSYKFITYEIARSGSTFTAVVILRRKKFISRIFSRHRLLGENREDTWIYEDKKCKEHLKNRLKTEDLYLPNLVKEDDVTELCLASSTRPRRRNLLAALAQYTVSHFRSSSTKSSSWFLSSLLFFVAEDLLRLHE